MEKSDPGDIIAHTLGRSEGGGEVGYIIAGGGDVRIYEGKAVAITEMNKSLHLS